MTMKKPVLLIPVENQVRELDAKLLLACVAAKRDLTSIIGPKRKIENRIASFPRGIFLSKTKYLESAPDSKIRFAAYQQVQVIGFGQRNQRTTTSRNAV